LSNVILDAKQNNYNNQILVSNNKIKTTWESIRVESSKKINKSNNEDIQEMNVDGKSNDNPEVIANIFNEHFLSVAEKTHQNNKNIGSNNNVDVSDIRSKNGDNIIICVGASTSSLTGRRLRVGFLM
jgi:hypothetical protein